MINGSESRTPELAVSLAVYEYLYFAPFCVYHLYPLTDLWSDFSSYLSGQMLFAVPTLQFAHFFAHTDSRILH